MATKEHLKIVARAQKKSWTKVQIEEDGRLDAILKHILRAEQDTGFEIQGIRIPKEPIWAEVTEHVARVSVPRDENRCLWSTACKTNRLVMAPSTHKTFMFGVAEDVDGYWLENYTISRESAAIVEEFDFSGGKDWKRFVGLVMEARPASLSAFYPNWLLRVHISREHGVAKDRKNPTKRKATYNGGNGKVYHSAIRARIR